MISRNFPPPPSFSLKTDDDHAPADFLLRVSTAKQGKSGLGIEAQRSAMEAFAKANEFEIVGEFVEFESGKGSDALDRRP